MKATTYQQLMAEQARSAVRVSGAHHSSWNGRVGVAAPERKVRGAVAWDHTIEYSDEKVTAPLKEMYANARVYNQDAETLRWYREAVKAGQRSSWASARPVNCRLMWPPRLARVWAVRDR